VLEFLGVDVTPGDGGEQHTKAGVAEHDGAVAAAIADEHGEVRGQTHNLEGLGDIDDAR
jgi:hypothetical protein